MGAQYPELIENQERITAVTVNEEESFLTTLKSGTQIFDLAAETVKQSKSAKLDGDTVFKLHDTYGFPFDLTLEMASEKGLSVDEDGFRRLMKEQKDRAKADARSKKTGHTDVSEYRKIFDAAGATKFTGYSETSSEAKIAAIMVDGKPVNEADVNSDVEIILDRTPFYAEGGGQLPDGGLITLSNGAVVEIDDVQTPVPGLFIHRGQVISGSLYLKSSALASIDIERRLAISRAHTATHMVHKAFREILGETATQAGSENSPGRFRFDFPATGAVPTSVLEEVEGRVNNLLLDNLSVTAKVMTQPEAKAMGAMALFGEKYGDQVRVVSVGDWAHELCGGTHVKSSGELGVVKLLSEASIGAGVRRVEALVGRDAYGFLAREHILLNSITQIIKGSRVEELPSRISDLVDKLKSVEKELASFKTAQILASATTLLKSTSKVAGFEILSSELEADISGDDLRTISLDLRNRLSDGIVILASKGSERSTIVVAVSPNAVKSGIKAGALVKLGSEILGGGGGGKDDFAQGGGTNHGEIGSALAAISKSIGQTAGN
jgi:alanyl-tRNA synthetase